MRERLFPARDVAVWIACFTAVAAALILTHFTSSDPDSALYAGLADRLSQEPVHRWLAPEWWGFWPEAQMTGYFREHPAGVLLVPAALTKLGIPALQGAYVVGVAAGLGSLLMMAALIHRFAPVDRARASLLLLQLMPVAFIFRIRANHEYPMLVCLLCALHGMVAAASGRLWMGALLVSLGLAGGLVIKGVFVTLILLAIALWILVDPIRNAGGRTRCAIAAAIGIAFAAGIGFAYDAAYLRTTGEPFWTLYWQRQVGPLTQVGATDVLGSFVRNLVFYVSRVVWHPAPWSFALLVAGWRMRHRWREAWRTIAARARPALVFALLFAGLAILLLSPSSRFAERYAFPSTHAVACAGVVVACGIWPAMSALLQRLDRRLPALPALLWLALALLRLAGGSLLPRIS